MLKLEKASKNHDIYIRMRYRERFYNSSLKKALYIALSLHLFAGLLFHISPFKLFSERILPPIVVEADLSESIEESENGTLAHLEGEETPLRALLTPKSSSPKLPALPKLILLSKLEIFNQEILAINPFIEIEKDYRQNSFKTTFKYQPSIQVAVSGPLAQKDPPYLNYPMSIDIPFSEKLSFDVQVQNKTGKIFWISAKKNHSQSLNKLAEQVLKEIEFPKEFNEFITSGEIDIMFHSFSNVEPL